MVMVVVLAACSGKGGDACVGLVEPNRAITTFPGVLSLDVGVRGQVAASVYTGCAADNKSVVWTSNDPEIATVDASGTVLAVGPGRATLTVSAFDDQARSVVAVVVRARAAATLSARPRADTLFTAASRMLVANVRDQRGDLFVATVTWRSLTPSLATVSAKGEVSALTAGIARIEASIPMVTTDSLRDTVQILIIAPPAVAPIAPSTPAPTPPAPTPPAPTPPAPTPPAPTPPAPTPPAPTPPAPTPPAPTPPAPTPPAPTPPAPTPPAPTPPAPTPPAPTPPAPTPPAPTPPAPTPPAPTPPAPSACSVITAVQLGTTFAGRIGSSTCQNLYGFRVADQYSVSVASTTSYALRLAPTTTSTLVPLNIGDAFQQLAAATTAVTAIVVLRAGTFGFLVTAPSTTAQVYAVTTVLNPDPQNLCVATFATTGVSFNTAITRDCRTRDVRIVPALTSGQRLVISATSAGRAVTIQLRHATTGAVLGEETTNDRNPTATITYTNGVQAQSVLVRVSGGANVNSLVPMTISR